MYHTEDTTWLWIRRLGYAGLAPFVILAFLLWLVDADLHPFIALAMAGYGAVIVSFLGGIHWGIGLRHNAPQRKLHMAWGVMPSLVAWIAVIMPAYAGLPLLAMLLVPAIWSIAKLGPKPVCVTG